MAKASPARNLFNGGEFSPFLEGRTDLDRYPASMRRMYNFVPLPQGPAVRRPGTAFTAEVYDHAKKSRLIPFIFNEGQSLQLEFCDERIRFIFETGIQVNPSVAITSIVATTPLKFTAAGHGLVVGDQTGLNGFAAVRNLNGRVFNVTAISGNDVTVDVNYTGSTGAIAGATSSEVYYIVSPYDHLDLDNIRAIQSVDVVYLLCPGYRLRKLTRKAAYDWTIETIEFKSGPFVDEGAEIGRLKPASTGSPIPVMTDYTTPSGIVSASSENAGKLAWHAFDDNDTTFWQSNVEQSGILTYEFPSVKIITGYVIYHGTKDNAGSSTVVDRAPGNWSFEGWDGADWIILDTQSDYTIYSGGRSLFFKLNNTEPYIKYRLNITSCTRNGTLKPSVGLLLMQEKVPPTIALTLSGAYDKVNGGVGFKNTDVGRIIRLKGADNYWRTGVISTYTSATSVSVTLYDEPLNKASSILHWQFGYWSDTTGWPTVAEFFEDRLWLSGSTDYPDMVAGSKTGGYLDFATKTPLQEVLDDSAIVATLNSEQLSRVKWLKSDTRGLIIGTGAAEWVISASKTEDGVSARNIKARKATGRGSASVEPVKIDHNILYTQVSRKNIREFAYVFEADGYKSPSMSLFASHLASSRFAQMVYASEPHSIVWVRRDDGSLIGLTYNRDENVIGWHQHNLADGIVESLSVIPSGTTYEDVLWFVVRRTINGTTKRYIERLTAFFDFTSTLMSSQYVDCGLRYDGAPINIVTGLSHLEGQQVYGLADSMKIGPLTVAAGQVVLPNDMTAASIVLGLRYSSEGEISRIEAGAADGTAQGKVKRIHNITLHLWQSAGGFIGKYNEDNEVYDYDYIEYKEPVAELQPVNLQKGFFGPFPMPRGYGKDGTLAFKTDDPMPFNVIALLPQMNTQDR